MALDPYNKHNYLKAGARDLGMGGSEYLSATRRAKGQARSPPDVPLCLAPWSSI